MKTKKPSADATKPINVVLPLEIYNQLEEAGARENRKKANLARIFIEEGLARRNQNLLEVAR